MKNNKNIRIRIAGIVLNKKNELLLVNHVKNGRSYWLLPGGGVEFGEDLFTAIKREFKEELSMKVTSLGKLILVHETIYPGGKRHIINLYFAVKTAGAGKFRVKPDGVLKGAAFVPDKDFKKFLFYPAVKSAIITSWKKHFSGTMGYIKTRWKT